MGSFEFTMVPSLSQVNFCYLKGFSVIQKSSPVLGKNIGAQFTGARILQSNFED